MGSWGRRRCSGTSPTGQTMLRPRLRPEQTWEWRPVPRGSSRAAEPRGSGVQALPTLLRSSGLRAWPATLLQPWTQGKPPFCLGALRRVTNAPLQLYKENITMAFPSRLPSPNPSPASATSGSGVSSRPSVKRALGRSRKFPFEPKNRTSLTGAQRTIPLGRRRRPGTGLLGAAPPAAPLLEDPGAQEQGPFGPTRIPSPPQPIFKLVSGSSAQGTYTALLGGLERPQDRRGLTHPQAFRTPPGPPLSAARRVDARPQGSARRAPALNSAPYTSRPFQVPHGYGRKRSGITGPPARSSCARAGARMEEHR